ncbi:MAG: hypothetical protein WA821_02290 [Anaerolineales bacterium]
MKTKTLLGIVFAIAVLAASFESAGATLGLWSYKGVANIKGTSYGYTGKMVRKIADGRWAADIVSYTDYPPVKITLGWTYFTARETCDGRVRNQIIKGGTAVWSAQIATTTYMRPQPCVGGTRYGYSIGKHELKGTFTWMPEWSHGEILP